MENSISLYVWHLFMYSKTYDIISRINKAAANTWKSSFILTAIFRRKRDSILKYSYFYTIFSLPFVLINKVAHSKIGTALRESVMTGFIEMIWNLISRFLKKTKEILLSSFFGRIFFIGIGFDESSEDKIDLTKTCVFLTVFITPIMPTTIVIAATIICIILFGYQCFTNKNVQLRIDSISVLVLAFMTTYVLSMINSFSRRASLSTLFVYLIFMCFYFIITNIIRTKKDVFNLVKTFILSSMLVSLYGIYQYIFGVSMESSWVDANMFESIKTRVYSTLGNPNVLGEYLILIIPIAVFYLFVKTNLLNKLAYFASLGAMLLCIVLTFSRGAWVGLILSVGIFVMFAVPKIWAVLLMLAYCVFITLPDSVINRFASIGNTSDSSTSYRIGIWVGTILILKEFILSGIGIGVGAFHTVYPLFSYRAMVAHHSHNLFLQIATEAGILGIVAFVTIIIFLFFKSVKVYSQSSRIKSLLVLSIVAAIIGFMAQSMFDYSFYNYRVMLVFWQIIGFLMAIKHVVFDETLPKSAEEIVYE